ncbi:MAG TPA: MMPL family transporter, partial [Chthoniobacterales bacterium]
PWLLAGAAAVILAASFFAITRENRFDSEILNLLPADNRAVQGLKIYNRDFTQTRELAFLIRGESAEAGENFADFLIPKLRQQPWTLRLLEGAPLETPEGRETFPSLGAALLLNLPPDQFPAALAGLNAADLPARLKRLVQQVRAGSPRAEFELENDPLGLLAPALAPLAKTISLETDFALVSPNGATRLIPVIVRPELPDDTACAALMDQVHAFIAQVRSEYGPAAPIVEVTGRAAYVAEISTSMKRDLRLTSLISLAAISGLFWLGYRRVFPLAGAALILSGCALAAMGTGTWFYPSLNVVAIGFCSILFGLGNDYSLLLYEAWREARRRAPDFAGAVRGTLDHVLPGVVFVAFTTCIGFLALRFSGSIGFAQLGVLTSLGVAFCAAAMLTLFPLWLRFHRPAEAAPTEAFYHSLQNTLADLPPVMGRGLLAGFIGVTLLALLPWRPLAFDLSPASLEPRNIPASRALAHLQQAFPDSSEPVMIAGRGAALAERVDARLIELKRAGEIAGFSGASALLVHPDRAARNRALWQSHPAGESELAEWFSQAGLDYSQFPETHRLLEALRQEGPPLPESSPWWFLRDRLISGDQFIAYVRPAKNRPFTEALFGPLARETLVTGWSTLLGSLVPWAQRELIVYGGAVAGIILLVLAAIYRDARVWGVHVLGLIFAYGGLAATLKLLGVKLNLLNVLAFPLILGTGVDYGTHLLLTLRHGEKWREHLTLVFRPILFGALTTVAGFAALIPASSPALSGLGLVCALGVAWTLISALFFILPAMAWMGRANRPRPARPPSPPSLLLIAVAILSIVLPSPSANADDALRLAQIEL